MTLVPMALAAPPSPRSLREGNTQTICAHLCLILAAFEGKQVLNKDATRGPNSSLMSEQAVREHGGEA